MGSKMTTAQVVKLDLLEQGRRKWDRVRKLVELAAVSPKSADDLMRQCHRTAQEAGRFFGSNGFGPLSTYAVDLATHIKRPGTFQGKLGALRETVGKGYAGFDRAQLSIKSG